MSSGNGGGGSEEDLKYECVFIAIGGTQYKIDEEFSTLEQGIDRMLRFVEEEPCFNGVRWFTYALEGVKGIRFVPECNMICNVAYEIREKVLHNHLLPPS